MMYEVAKKICAESNKRPLLRGYLAPAKNHSGDSGYCCIFCGSGTGEHGTGAVTVYGNHAKCFSANCGKIIRNTDIAAHCLGLTDTTGENFFKVAEFLAQELGITIETNETAENFFTSKIKKKNEGAAAMKEQPKKDYSNFYRYSESRLAEFISKHGGSWRGLSLKDLQAACAGFSEREIDGAKIQSVILPHNNFSYFERSVTDAPRKIKQHHGTPKVIFNPYDVLKCGKPIFIVEGEIDCISVHKFDYPCIALGGAAEGNLLMKTLATEFEGVADKPKFIVMFDNNDGGKGQQVAQALIKNLSDSGYNAVNFILSQKLQYDSNEFLQTDSAAFSARLAEIYKTAEKEFAALESETYGTRLNFFFQHKYLDSTSKQSHFEDLQTGFENLDEMQEFESGIYTIGAPPSLGKTSFVWQLLEQMARCGNEITKIHCVFASYEMSEEVLFSKSMVRGVFELNRKNNECFEPNENLTSARIRKGIPFVTDYQEDCLKVLEQLQNDYIDLRVLDLTTNPLEIDDLIKRLEKIAATLPAEDILIFAIDYLQRIPNKNQETAKGAVDYAMQEIKKFTQKTNSICFLISSYNRGAYRIETGFEAFKESGSVEYGSDILLALQLYCTDDKGEFSTSQKDFDLAKSKQPRPMILKCLKNRFGNDYKIFFRYYSAVDTFVPCTESELNTL